MLVTKILRSPAEDFRGKKVHPQTRVVVTPASARIYKKALRNGLIEIFMDAGCTVTGTGCGACIGRHGGVLAPGDRAWTTMNRNFVGRMGSPLSEIYLASPATAAVSALTGRITEPAQYSGNHFIRSTSCLEFGRSERT